jgi:hypothetical protein
MIRVFNDILLPLCVGDLYRLTREPFTTLWPALFPPPPRDHPPDYNESSYMRRLFMWMKKRQKRKRNAKKIMRRWVKTKSNFILMEILFYVISWRWQFPYFPSHFPFTRICVVYTYVLKTIWRICYFPFTKHSALEGLWPKNRPAYLRNRYFCKPNPKWSWPLKD